MRINKKIFLPLLIIIISNHSIFGQPPGGPGGPGGRGAGFDPNEMIAREKQNVLDHVTNLSEDQVVLLNGIYEEFGKTIKETFEEMRGSGDREAMRSKMQGLRKEKDALIMDVLSEDQFAQYKTITAPRERKKPDQEKKEENLDTVE